MQPTLEIKNNIVIVGKPKLEFMGFLLFKLCFHVVWVPNCMIASTIVDARGKIPSFEHGGDFIICEVDLKTFKFPLW